MIRHELHPSVFLALAQRIEVSVCGIKGRVRIETSKEVRGIQARNR